MEQIIESIKKEMKISNETIALLRESLIPLQVSKKTLLIDPFVKDGNLYIVEKGIARAFTVIDGKEITSWFSQEGDLLYSTNSFHGKTEGYEEEMVQVLEDSLLYYMPLSRLEELCFSNIEIANWIRIIHQKAFLNMERRLIYRFNYSAEERYKDFMKHHSVLFHRVNLGYIASYLGMSHVTLCALRKS